MTSNNTVKKKIGSTIYITLLIFLFSSFGNAQSLWGKKYTMPKFEITPFTGYMLGGYLNVYQGQVSITDNQNYGLSFVYTVPFGKGVQVEAFWLRQQSSLNLQERGDFGKKKLFDIDTHYMQIGGIYGVRNKNWMPFGSMSFGLTLFHPQSFQYSDEWQFSITVGGGLKYYLTRHFGLRLQARALIPLYWNGGGIWCGPGGCSVGIGSTSLMLQADFTAGLMITL